MPARPAHRCGDGLAAGRPLDVRGCALPWAISLDGNAKVNGVEADVDVPFSDALKDLSFGAMLLVDARRGRFGIAANGLFTRVSPEEEVGPIEIHVTTDLAQLGIGPYYRALEWQYGESAAGRPLRLVLEPWVGARLNHLRLELELRGRVGSRT